MDRHESHDFLSAHDIYTLHILSSPPPTTICIILPPCGVLDKRPEEDWQHHVEFGLKALGWGEGTIDTLTVHEHTVVLEYINV